MDIMVILLLIVVGKLVDNFLLTVLGQYNGAQNGPHANNETLLGPRWSLGCIGSHRVAEVSMSAIGS